LLKLATFSYYKIKYGFFININNIFYIIYIKEMKGDFFNAIRKKKYDYKKEKG